jgi:glutamate synthase (NADPH/NADH) large chain
MGISTIRSYRGAKIFESIGLSEDLLRRYFGTEVSTIGGVGLKEIARDAIALRKESLTPDPSPKGEGSRYYDLQGRKWSNGQLSKGVYITNGKKHVVR